MRDSETSTALQRLSKQVKDRGHPGQWKHSGWRYAQRRPGFLGPRGGRRRRKRVGGGGGEGQSDKFIPRPKDRGAREEKGEELSTARKRIRRGNGGLR